MMVDMMIDTGPRFNSAIRPALANDLKVKVRDFYVKVLNSSYFPDHTMDLV